MNWRILKNNKYNDYALFLDTEGESILVALIDRLSQVNDDILKNENTKYEEV